MKNLAATATLFFLSLILLFPSETLAVSTEWKQKSHSRAQVVTSVNRLQPGAVAYLGLRIQLNPGWHSYWENSGDFGATPILKWNLPEPLRLASVLWPTPKRIITNGLHNFGYSKEVILMQELALPQDYIEEFVNVELDAEWLVCHEICVPQKDTWSFKIPVGPQEADEDLRPIIGEQLRQLPEDNKNVHIQWQRKNSEVIVKVSGPQNIKVLDFFPYSQMPVSNEPPQIQKDSGNDWTLTLKHQTLTGAIEQELRGLLIYEQEGQQKSLQVFVHKEEAASFWQYLVWAFLGGLILNLMPCVLPLILLKAFHIVKQSQSSPHLVRRDSFLYTAGVLFSLWTLSLLILLLQKAGHLVGWGFHLQSPFFNAFLIIVFVIMALNLLGLFEIQVMVPGPIQKWLQLEDAKSAFSTGLLSVVVASPCTAPFMGVAIGFALSQSALTILAIFTSLGLGLAFPYILLAFFPEMVRYFPKPGPWMLWFKKILAIPLFLTAMWLAWVMWNQIRPSVFSSNDSITWQEFDEREIEALRGRQALFLDFTADWCITCKVNERVVFRNPEVRRVLEEKDLILIKADWTNSDPRITSWLKRYKRAGVPFYLLFDSEGHEEILPEVLTPQLFLKSIEKIHNKKEKEI